MPAAKTRQAASTDAELLVLGLVAEMPRHGYELDREIERRAMREWTPIGFSSVYFVLEKLHGARLVSARKPAGPKSRKTFRITAAGRRALAARTLEALATPRATTSSAALGMLHLPFLDHDAALDALAARGEAVAEERERLDDLRAEQQPLPDHVEALFDLSFGRLESEADWIARTLAYLRVRPRLE